METFVAAAVPEADFYGTAIPSKAVRGAARLPDPAMNYGPAAYPLAILNARDRGAISVYAQGRDYHDVVKSRLKALARFIAARHAAEVKVFVDTAPLMEKPLAQAAGLGWQGKHSNLVSRGFGSWLFLGEVLTTLELEPDAAESDHCGECRRCLDACPTQAFPAPYRIDARRCISYLTIEHKGHIAPEFRAAMGNRIYGCDDCLAVCPWNKFAQAAPKQSSWHATSCVPLPCRGCCSSTIQRSASCSAAPGSPPGATG